MNFFSNDSPFFRAILKACNMVWLNLLWLICCIPIFTIGASTTAFYYTIQKNIKNNLGNTGQQFFRGFRENFKQSTLIWLILFAFCMLFSYDLAFFTDYGLDGHPVFYSMRYIWYGLLFVEIVYFLYLFPYLARFSNTIKNTFINTTMLILRHPVQLLKILFFLAFAVFMIWFLPFLIFVMPGVALWQISIIMERIYQIYMSAEDKELERIRTSTGEED